MVLNKRQEKIFFKMVLNNAKTKHVLLKTVSSRATEERFFILKIGAQEHRDKNMNDVQERKDNTVWSKR